MKSARVDPAARDRPAPGPCSRGAGDHCEARRRARAPWPARGRRPSTRSRRRGPGANSTFDGLRSRCSTPAVVQHRDGAGDVGGDRAAPRRTGIGPAASRSASVPPAAYVITRYGRPSGSSPTSNTRTSRSESARRMILRLPGSNRSRTSAWSDQFSASTFTATSESQRSSAPSHTVANAPEPIRPRRDIDRSVVGYRHARIIRRPPTTAEDDRGPDAVADGS